MWVRAGVVPGDKLALQPSGESEVVFDLVIRNGTVIDGTGTAGRFTDVGIRGERIIAVEPNLAKGDLEIDAQGLIVTPGFVDPHTHYDGQATWDPYLAPSSFHGVTTAVMGNCGVGFAPVHDRHHDWLISVMEGVEDIPGTALHEGLKWDWSSYPEYLDALERQPRTIDVAAYLPHVALRTFVMGKRGADPGEHPSDEELVRLTQLVEEALDYGAIGVSTSRTERHRTGEGENLGTLRSREPELFAIAEGLRNTGKGVFQLLSDSYRTTDDRFAESEFQLTRDLARSCARPLSYTVQQDIEAPNRWRELMTLAQSLTDDGLDVKAQVAPRPIGVLLGLQASVNVFSPSREMKNLNDLSLQNKVLALRDPDRRAKILAAHQALTTGPDAFAGNRFYGRFDDMYILDDPVNYDLANLKSLGETAREQKLDPREFAFDVQLDNGGKQLIYAPLFNFVDRDFSAIREMITSPVAMFGLSDAGAHCGLICDASMATSFITLWSRDRTDETALALEWVIHQLSLRPARHFGFDDRGVIAPGYLADLNVIDVSALNCTAPHIVHDLPAGGRRLLQEATGYRATIKRGVVTFENGEMTGALPGQLLRGCQPPPRDE